MTHCSSLSTECRSALQQEQGVVIVITALSLVAMIILVGLVVDSGMLEFRKLTLDQALTAASLRGSQMYYDGADQNDVMKAAREVARLNLALAKVPADVAASTAGEMSLLTSANKLTALGSISQPLFFAQVLPNVGGWKTVQSAAAASYVRMAGGPPHYKHLFVVVSIFESMNAPFRKDLAAPETSPRSLPTKAQTAIAGLHDLFNSLDGEELTLVGYGQNEQFFTHDLPINDRPSLFQPGVSNRDYAKQQAAKLAEFDRGARLSNALESVLKKINALPEEERLQSLVLVISDGVAFKGTLMGSLSSQCGFESGADIELANRIREAGAVVSSVGIFAKGAVLEDEDDGTFNIEDIWQSVSLFGREFLKSLASAENSPMPCQGFATVSPNDLRDGAYYEPTSAREFSALLDEVTSRPQFVAQLPRRLPVN
ncbi:MAG: hypothetical protein U0136_16285 [Bdellovibrionota bacterium]